MESALDQLDKRIENVQIEYKKDTKMLKAARSKLLEGVSFTAGEIFIICDVLCDRTGSYQGEGELRRGIRAVEERILAAAEQKFIHNERR